MAGLVAVGGGHTLLGVDLITSGTVSRAAAAAAIYAPYSGVLRDWGEGLYVPSSLYPFWRHPYPPTPLKVLEYLTRSLALPFGLNTGRRLLLKVHPREERGLACGEAGPGPAKEGAVCTCCWRAAAWPANTATPSRFIHRPLSLRWPLKSSLQDGVLGSRLDWGIALALSTHNSSYSCPIPLWGRSAVAQSRGTTGLARGCGTAPLEGEGERDRGMDHCCPPAIVRALVFLPFTATTEGRKLGTPF